VAPEVKDKASILVVDDQQSISMLISRSLESIGCEVTVAFDGEEALVLGMENDFDLVLIDNWLPGLLGVEVLQAWKEAGRPFPVILVSALSDQDAIVKSLQLGAVDFIRKPFDVQELLARVNVHLRVPMR
jgi:two-component system copper resistance phosphate regulon response regulator CusR